MLIIWAVNVTDTLDRIKKCIPMVRERVMNVCQEWQRNYYYKGRRNIELAYEANEPIENK